MSTLYLHIGTPKTGTTSLQRFFMKNRIALRKQGCKFPVFSDYDTGVHISHNGRFLSSIIKDKKYVNKCFETIYELSKKYSKIIITEELLWNKGGEKQKFWKELKDKLSSHSIELKVIVYLRRQDEYIISHWAQKVKGRKTKSVTFDKYLQKRSKEKNHLDYYEYLCNVADTIGEKNIIVRPYEFCQFQGKNKSIFSDFLQSIGIECDETFKIPEKMLNQSLKGNVLEAKRYLNMIPEFSEKSFEFRNYFWEIQEELIKLNKLRNCSTFLNQERQKFMAEYNLCNSLVAKKFLGKKDGLLFLEPLPKDNSTKRVYTVEEIQIVLDMIMTKIKKDMFSPMSPKEFEPIYNQVIDIVKAENSLNNKNKILNLAYKIKFIHK